MQILISIIFLIIFRHKFTFLRERGPTLKKLFHKKITQIMNKIKSIFRLLNIKKRADIVWKDLIKLHKEAKWHFGQFDINKHIETSFHDQDGSIIKFNYRITHDDLLFNAIILQSFNEDFTNDIMVLASHFNGLLNFGKVIVNLKYNYIEFEYSRDLVTYMVYPGKIHTDISVHYNLTIDCIWAFSTLLETGDNPVFVISEFLKRKKDNKKQK